METKLPRPLLPGPQHARVQRGHARFALMLGLEGRLNDVPEGRVEPAHRFGPRCWCQPVLAWMVTEWGSARASWVHRLIN